MSSRLIRLEALINTAVPATEVDADSGRGTRTTADDTVLPRTDSHPVGLSTDVITATTAVTRSEWPPPMLGSVLEHHQPNSRAATNFGSEESYADPSQDQMAHAIFDAACSESQSAILTATTGAKFPSNTKNGNPAMGRYIENPALQENSNLGSGEMVSIHS